MDTLMPSGPEPAEPPGQIPPAVVTASLGLLAIGIQVRRAREKGGRQQKVKL